MTDVVYRIVEHDGGWAYKLGDVFSETFRSRGAAEAAAKQVAAEQRTPGEDEAISWEDAAGVWHDEAARGSDRPNATVADLEAAAAGAAGAVQAQPTPSWQGAAARSMGDRAFAAYDRGDQVARQGARIARGQIRSDPLLAALLAAACGLILGTVLQRRR
jgi:hypothetical protein